MREYCYEKIDLHIEEHNSFIYKLDEITKTNFTGDTLNANLSSFLNKWFLNHILKVDNELAVFLLKRENNNAGQVNRVTEQTLIPHNPLLVEQDLAIAFSMMPGPVC